MKRIALVLGLWACGHDPTSTSEPASAEASSPVVPAPADNPQTPEKSALGRLLFFDPILSGNRDVACATCHQPALAYTDGLAFSHGTEGQTTAREALTVLDTAWNGATAESPEPDPMQAPMFWDARVRSLETQARGPITGQSEMRGSSYTEDTIFPELVARLSAIPDYASKFEAVFGPGDIDDTKIVCAIAAFERTLVTVPSFSRFLAGDTNAMSAAAKAGYQTFQQNGCSRCHAGPMLSDWQLHRFTRGGEAIRTPSLRNVTRTAPYMHDGRAATLDAVFDIYRHVDHGADPLFANLRAPNPRDEANLVAFLTAASDGAYDQTAPDAVPSGLVAARK